MKRPRSSRLAYSDMPIPSCQSILIRSPLRPRNTQRSPTCGSLQALLNLQGQPAHAAPHVAVAGCNPDPDTARNRDHRASTRSVVETSASGAFAMIFTRARPISITIAAAGETGVEPP